MASKEGNRILEDDILKSKVKEIRDYIYSLSASRYENFNKFMILYVKFIHTENENKAKRYIGMMANILG